VAVAAVLSVSIWATYDSVPWRRVGLWALVYCGVAGSYLLLRELAAPGITQAVENNRTIFLPDLAFNNDTAIQLIRGYISVSGRLGFALVIGLPIVLIFAFYKQTSKTQRAVMGISGALASLAWRNLSGEYRSYIWDNMTNIPVTSQVDSQFEVMVFRWARD